MRLDIKTILIATLIGLAILLILFRGCGQQKSTSDSIDIYKIYDSIERVIKSEIPAADTIIQIKEREVLKWLPGAVIRDTVEVQGETVFVYNDAEIDTNAILTHYLTQAVTYTDTIRDSSLQAVIQDTIFRNKIQGRGFTYKLLQPTKIKYVDNTDKFQLILSFQAGAGVSYINQFNGLYAGADIGLKFKSGTYFSLGYMAGSSHFATIRAGQVIRLKKRKKKLISLL